MDESNESKLKYYREKVARLDLELKQVCGHELDLRMDKLKCEQQIEAIADAEELKLLGALKHGTLMSILVPSKDLTGTVEFSAVNVYKYIMELKGEEINM